MYINSHTTLYFFLLVFQSQVVFSQSKKFTVVIGSKGIQNLQSNKELSNLAPHDVIFLDTPIKFIDKQANAFLVDETWQEYELKFREDKPNLLLKDVLIPKASKPLTNKRGLFNIVTDLNNYFGEDGDVFYIIGDSLKIKLDEKKYPIDSIQYIAYKVIENGKTKARRLQMLKDNHIIISKDLLKYTKPDGTISLYWLKTKPKMSSIEIVKLKALFLDESNLSATFQKLVQMANDKKIPEAGREKYFTSQFEQFFGNTDFLILSHWLKKQGFLK